MFYTHKHADFGTKVSAKKDRTVNMPIFTFKFFHKTTKPTTKGTSQEINQMYQQQVDNGNVLVHISQISFMNWQEVQQLAQSMKPGIFQQTISIATLNKKAEHQYQIEIKNQKRLDDDPSLILEQKINTLNKYYDSLIKKNIKNEQAIKSLTNKTQTKQINLKEIRHQNNKDQMVDESNNDKNNIPQQQIQKLNTNKMEEEIDTTASNKKQQEQKNLIRRTGEQQNKKNNQIPNTHFKTTQLETKDLPRIILSKSTKTPSKELQNQDPDKSLDDPSIIAEANEYLSRIAEKVDPHNIYELMRIANQQKELPNDETNLIISQRIQYNKLWTSRLIQMISNNNYCIDQIYAISGKQNRKLQKQTKLAIYISAPILYIIIQQTKKSKKEIIPNYMYSMASLIMMTISNYLIKEKHMKEEDKPNVEDMQMILLNAYQKGTQDAFKVNHIIQFNKDEKNPFYAIINIARDNKTNLAEKLNILLQNI
ncbi:hypothetical protein ABPG72_018701 [Tetrahymena utriculariae]